MPTERRRRLLWYSRDRQRTWVQVEVLERAPLFYQHIPSGTTWTDGYGNYYREDPPGEDE